MELVILIFIALFIAFFIYMAFTRKGKSILFGGEIVKTIGNEVGSKRGIVNATVKVHVVKTTLPKPNEYQIGLELGQKSFASYQMTPITLSTNEAKALICMLEEAINYEQKT